MRTRLSLTFTVAAVLVLASGTAEARPGAKLSVTKVSSPPPAVVPGASFVMTGKVENDGERAAKPSVALSLRRGGDAGPLGMRIANRRIEEVRPGDSVRFRETVTVRAATPDGEYGLSACVRKRGNGGPHKCLRADARMTVAGPRPPGDGNGPVAPEPDPPSPGAGPVFEPGARSAGDVLFPAIGNGGYDVDHYDVALDYDPVLNNFDAATTTITAEATKNLSEFSLDMQGMTVSSVAVDGQAATFTRENTKLIIDPAGAGIPSGDDFVTAIAYNGPPVEVVDPDGSSEGWVRTPDGGFVVNEPIGAQGWFPNNNYPTDKATFDFHITVPLTATALGNGELVSTDNNGDGTQTWNWHSDQPVSTYLTTATVGTFIFTEGTITETTPTPDRVLPEYRAIDSSYLATLPAQNAELDRIEEMTNFLGSLYGPYPFDSTGAVVDAATVGYALEVQTKPHFALPFPVSTRSTLLHEIAHQWFGNAVTLATWSDIWFNEGWAVWSEWYWDDELNGGTTSPEQQFDTEYANAGNDWSIPPATLDEDPTLLFETFPVYTRSAMMLQGYREIVGHTKFLELAQRLQTDYEDDNISTAEFIGLAKEVSDFTGAQLARLDDYFQQWLYGETKPTITPDNF